MIRRMCMICFLFFSLNAEPQENSWDRCLDCCGKWSFVVGGLQSLVGLGRDITRENFGHLPQLYPGECDPYCEEVALVGSVCCYLALDMLRAQRLYKKNE